MADVRTEVTAYEVCAVPYDEYGNYGLFTIKVEKTHHTGTWAVRRMGRCLGADGEWDWEPLPSSREEDWLVAHRFDLKTALDLAERAAPHIVVNGQTVTDVVARGGGL